MKAAEGLGKCSVIAVAVAAVLALGAVPAQATTYYVAHAPARPRFSGGT